MERFSAFGAGVLFSLGLIVSGMTNPAKIIGFLDLTGNWDPSLALVMGGALGVSAIGYRVVLARPKPVFTTGFSLPTKTTIDRKLVVGAGMFGVGWGLAGLCPGPAIAALTFGGGPVLAFFAAMLVGMIARDRFMLRPATS